MNCTISFSKSGTSISCVSSIYSNENTFYPVREEGKNLLFKLILLMKKKVKINIRNNEINNSGNTFLSMFCPF